MPTFESIGVHPELRSRLVTAAHKFDQEYQLVETPIALLSRNPNSLRLLDKQTGNAKPITLPQIRQLRQDIALAIIAQSASLHRANRIRQDVRELSLDGNGLQGLLNSTVEAFDSEAVIPGTVSALHLTLHDSSHIQQHTPISTSCSSLDQLMAMPPELQDSPFGRDASSKHSQSLPMSKGGVSFGYVTQFSGPSSSGKTQLCLQLAANTNPQTTSYYLSSSAALHCLAERLSTVARHSLALSHHHSQPYWTALQSTQFVHVPASDPYKLLCVLQQIESTFLAAKQENSQIYDGPNGAATVSDDTQPVLHGRDRVNATPSILVILDSASGCLNGIGNETLATVGLALKRLARQHGMAVVVTNGATRARSHTLQALEVDTRLRNWRPALGPTWRKIADIQIMLEPIASKEGLAVQATLERHVSKESPGSASFRVVSQGIAPDT